jgi:FMN phosphatase YigB (HAD superfamily)
LIIFDLDDTLIDTSGAVTPFKMRECLKKLGFSDDFEELALLNHSSSGSREAFKKFLDKKGAPHLIERAMEEMMAPLPDDFAIPTTPEAKEILNWLKKTHTLALVTGGHPPFQMEKLKKAGIDSSLFSKIAIPEDSIKKPFYRRLMEEFSAETLVCGDRIAMDLAPAHELGCTTVHMRWGRGKLVKTEPWIDHAIESLAELKRIIKR